jgi:hypothetical protein
VRGVRGVKPTTEELVNRFTYQPPPNKARAGAHAKVSRLCRELALKLVDICPAGRNMSLMLTHLEDVRMRANAALAFDSPAEEEVRCSEPPPNLERQCRVHAAEVDHVQPQLDGSPPEVVYACGCRERM